MARTPAPGNRGERPACRLCDRPATQLSHHSYKNLNHKYLKEIRQPAMLRRFPQHALCDSHLDSWGILEGINSGHLPDPKAKTSCKDCGETMRNMELSAHRDLHNTKREFDSINRRAETDQAVQKFWDNHYQRLEQHEQLKNALMKLTHLRDQIEGSLEEDMRKDDPKTGENYDEHY